MTINKDDYLFLCLLAILDLLFMIYLFSLANLLLECYTFSHKFILFSVFMLANITCILQFRHSPNLKLIYVIYCHANFYFVTCVYFIISEFIFWF